AGCPDDRLILRLGESHSEGGEQAKDATEAADEDVQGGEEAVGHDGSFQRVTVPASVPAGPVTPNSTSPLESSGGLQTARPSFASPSRVETSPVSGLVALMSTRSPGAPTRSTSQVISNAMRVRSMATVMVLLLSV